MGTMNNGGKNPGGNERFNNRSEETAESDSDKIESRILNLDNAPEGFDPSNDSNPDVNGRVPDAQGGERPSMDRFSGNSMNSGADTTETIVMLIVSSVVLAAGLIFAVRFKR